jgi:hypothetical protein
MLRRKRQEMAFLCFIRSRKERDVRGETDGDQVWKNRSRERRRDTGLRLQQVGLVRRRGDGEGLSLGGKDGRPSIDNWRSGQGNSEPLGWGACGWVEGVGWQGRVAKEERGRKRR